MSHFSVKLKALRLWRKLTRLELAARAGCTPQDIAFIEWGRRQPSWEFACRLACGLGVPVSYFDEP